MSGTTTEIYTYQAPMAGMPQQWGALVRGSDGAFIPCDGANRDFQAYLQFLRDGGTQPAGAPGLADFP
jgi:hypothetical protein